MSRIVPEDLPVEGRRFAGSLEVVLEADPTGDELVATEPVEYDLWAIRDGGRLDVNGSLSARLEARCSRCAQSFSVDVERDVELVYESAEASAAEPRPELDASDLSLDYYEGEAVELPRLLAEQVLLALPMKLVCADDCSGLCPKCGANHNRTQCDCEPDVDPRLASLEAIRDQL